MAASTLNPKKCTKCGKTGQFAKDAQKPDGLSSHCKRCISKKTRVYYQRNKSAISTKNRAYQLRARFGISEQEYAEMLVKQGGVCAICGSKDAGRNRNFYVDHNHVTGMVRGLLCNKCNTALGLFGDSVKNLERAAEYIRTRP